MSEVGASCKGSLTVAFTGRRTSASPRANHGQSILAQKFYGQSSIEPVELSGAAGSGQVGSLRSFVDLYTQGDME